MLLYFYMYTVKVLNKVKEVCVHILQTTSRPESLGNAFRRNVDYKQAQRTNERHERREEILNLTHE